MFPLFPFVAGLVAGSLAVRLWRREDTQAGVERAQDTLAAAAQALRQRLHKATPTDVAKSAAVPRKRSRPAGAAAVDNTDSAPASTGAAAKRKKTAARKRTARSSKPSEASS